VNIVAQDIPDVLPEFFLARANADDYYDDVVILIVDPGATESDLQTKLATLLGKDGKIGIALFILPIDTANDNDGSPSVGPLRLNIGFQVWENRLLNTSSAGTNKTGYNVARHTFELFKGFSVQGVCKMLVAEKPAIERVPPPAGKKLRGCGLNFSGREDDGFVIEKVAPVTFTPARGAATTVALASATSGAAIYYTTDNSAPGPDKTLYTAPITVPSGGFTLFAQSSKADCLPSDVRSSTFTQA